METSLKKYFALMLVAAFAVTAGCGKSSDDDLGGLPSGGGTSSSAAPAASGPTGTASISGKVTLQGKAPYEPPITFDADPVCKAQHPTPMKDNWVETDAKGDLKDVFVYVTDAPGNYPPPSAGVTLTQKGCMYYPHVFGIQVGQPLEILNEDATLHNIHCMATVNDPFNVGEPTKGMVVEKKFTKPEVLVKFKCDVHGWMHCAAGVVSNPFYSVSGDDGSFKISGLPAGTYTVVAAQEKYGESAPQTVTVTDGQAKADVNFTFTAQ
jgi:Carboxypeptidase regulatory-like domain